MRARRLSIGAPPTPERPSQRLSASAGEIGGNGGYTPVYPEFNRGVAASECAFSGLNDEYVLDDTSFSRVQTYPQTRAELAELGIVLPKGTPGFACNPTGKRAAAGG